MPEKRDNLYLLISAGMGMAGDMFSSALISLGVPENEMIQAMLEAARHIGAAEIKVKTVARDDMDAKGLDIQLDTSSEHLTIDEARLHLEKVMDEVGILSPYSDFAFSTLEILGEAEREAHVGKWLEEDPLRLEVIGMARTPYSIENGAPYQPFMVDDNDNEAFYIEIFEQFLPGIKGLDTFSHLDVIAYLNQSKGYSLTVSPPWKKGEGTERQVGLFASRSPNRPSPLGLTTMKIKKITGNRIYTGPMDLFDATPVVDIKPHIGSLDEKESRIGNDGWLEGSDHLRLHQEGVPHRHSAEKTVLHEAQDILIDITGAAFGLQYLGILPERVLCNVPVSVGGGKIRFSHGLLPVPAPAVTAILRKHRIPHVTGPVDVELLTPTGAALLAAMKPEWTQLSGILTDENKWKILKTAYGMGTMKLERPNVVKVILLEKKS